MAFRIAVATLGFLTITLLQSHPAASQVRSGAAQQALTSFPLATHENGQSMMQQAMSKLAPDVDFTFLNKTYKNDQYVQVAGKKVRTACVRFRATSGFRFKMDPPQFSLNTQGLTVTQTIQKIEANGLTVKFQLGPCTDIAAGIGVKMTDVKLVYRARPMLEFAGENCKLIWATDPDSIKVTIGDVNFAGVQNDLERLANNAVEDGINSSLDAFFNSVLRNELNKAVTSVCGSSK